MLRYEIEGGHLPVVICYPEAGQTICTEQGSMSWMSPNMQMETNSGGGFKKAIGRLFAGDSIFMNEYTPQGGSGMIAFASGFPGSIIPFDLRDESIIVQKRGFLAMEKGLDLSVYFQKKMGKGFFGGEGFIMQRISGTGMVFVEIDGHCKEYTLGVGESIVVDTGYLAAMSLLHGPPAHSGRQKHLLRRRGTLPYRHHRPGQGLSAGYAHQSAGTGPDPLHFHRFRRWDQHQAGR